MTVSIILYIQNTIHFCVDFVSWIHGNDFIISTIIQLQVYRIPPGSIAGSCCVVLVVLLGAVCTYIMLHGPFNALRIFVVNF